MYDDTSLPPRREMPPYTVKFLKTVGIPERKRMIHQSIFPLCTFGFALTKGAAYRLLNEIAPKESLHQVARRDTLCLDLLKSAFCREKQSRDRDLVDEFLRRKP